MSWFQFFLQTMMVLFLFIVAGAIITAIAKGFHR